MAINNISAITLLILFALSLKPDVNIIDDQDNFTYAGKAVIIIDDMGNQYKPCLPIIRSDYPVTLSILPDCPFSKKIAVEGHAAGHEIILHAPMESWDNASNLREAKSNMLFLTTSMGPIDLTREFEEMLTSVPHIIGISNHMGSKFTEDLLRMDLIMRILKERKLCFVDSRTTNDSKGILLAQEYNVASVERGLFLDNSQEYKATVDQIMKLINMAVEDGAVLGICHPYPTTIKALSDMLPQFKANNIKVVPLSELLN